MAASRYRFVQDDDCHWYLIPVGKEKAFHLWELSLNSDEDFDGEDFEDCAIGGGVGSYTFTDPQED